MPSRNLTGNNPKPYMKPIVEFIEKHSDIIRFGDQIRDGIDEVRANFLDWLTCEIIKDLEGGGFKVTRHRNLNRVKNYVLFLTPSNEAPFKVWIEYEPEFTHSLLVSLITENFHYESLGDDKQSQPVSPCPFGRMKEGMIKSFQGDDCYKPEQVFGGVCPIGVYEIIHVGNNECLAGLLKTPDSKVKAATDVCNRIRKFIKELEKTYTEAKQQTNI
jgi:hypothetical protein